MAGLSFFSADLGRTVNEEEVLGSTDLYFIEDIDAELGVAASAARAELDNRKKRARAYHEYLAPAEFNRLDQKRKDLGQFHQKVQRHMGRLRRDQQQKQPSRIPPVETFFFHAARDMLPQPDFQRLVLVAEQRRLVASNQQLRKEERVS